jgi:DNA-binding MarR family transcriptional regulator
MIQNRTLGTALRHLLALLDDDLETLYRADGLGYRPRYTPIVRALIAEDGLSIRAIAALAGITHSAVSQTITQMKRDGWVESAAGEDGRERRIYATDKLRDALPRLQQRWTATSRAAAMLDDELPHPLSPLIDAAITALEAHPFKARIVEASHDL